MALIKDIYSLSFYNQFADTAVAVYPSFNKQQFISRIFDNGFAGMEWKERMKHTTQVFHEFAPQDFEEATDFISALINRIKTEQPGTDTLPYVFLPDYIVSYGLDNFDTAVRAFENITQFVSCEFAVRPFILKYGDRMIDQMIKWAQHENYKVRRLATEGSRPRLPWAMALPALKKDPSAVLPLLELLKNDEAEWVRKSVANHINDIAKDHPHIVIDLARRWKGISKETDAIIKHGCRTLLKQGHAEILEHYELNGKDVKLEEFQILTPQVKTGNYLEFSITIQNLKTTEQNIRLEYGIFYLRGNGQLSKKVFKHSEKIYPAGALLKVHRKHSFRLITTRKFYPGIQELSVIINGEEKGRAQFEYIV